MQENIIVGSYSTQKGAYLRKTIPLKQVSFEDLRPLFIGEPCPYDFEVEPKQYQHYKTECLHLLYFTSSNYRPTKDDTNPYINSTNWFVLDIDHFKAKTKEETFELIQANCPPFVRFIQLTGKGLHIWCYCNLTMTNKENWMTVYDQCATEVYHVINTPFDQNCRNITQGTYIWHQNEANNYDNPNFSTSFSFDFTESLPQDVLYEQKCDDTKVKWNSTSDNKDEAAIITLDADFLKDYQQLSMVEFLRKYGADYSICSESERNFSYNETFWGEKIFAYKTNGRHYRVFAPKYYDNVKKSLQNRKLEDGQGRKKYLFCAGCAIMNINPNTTFEELLYNMVYYFLSFVDNSKDKITKKKLQEITEEAFAKHQSYHTEVLDKRKWIIGNEKILDEETGLYRQKTRGEKLREAQKLRKNEKVKEVMAYIDANLSVRENHERLKKHGVKISESYLRRILNEIGALPPKLKSKRVSAYRVSDGKRLSVSECLVDGKNYVSSKRDLLEKSFPRATQS